MTWTVKKRTVKLSAFFVLVASVVFVWGLGVHVDLVAQQKADSGARNEVALWNMYTGSDGLTHFRKLEMPYEMLIRVKGGAMFTRSRTRHSNPTARDPNAIQGEFHPGPFRRYMVTLSGSRRLRGSSGETFTADPNHILLIEDLTGKGHAFLGGGSDETVTLFIEVDEVTPRERLLGVCHAPLCTP